MVAPAVVAAGVSAASSLFSAFGSSSASDRLMKQQRKTLRQQRELQLQGFEMMKQEMDTWRDKLDAQEKRFAPIEDQVLSEATRGVDIGDMKGRAAQDVDEAFRGQRDQQRRDLMSYGIDPSSGRYVSSDRQAGLEQAKASALAQNQSRLAGDSMNRSLRSDALNLGLQKIGMANNNFNNFSNATGNMITNSANMLGQQAETLGQQGMQQAQLAGQQFQQAGLLSMYAADNLFNKPQPTTVSLAAGSNTSPNINIPSGMLHPRR